jgi:hypothetical protein
MEAYLNPGQAHLPECYNKECFETCLENGWVDGCFCRHPDRHTKSCAKCHGITPPSHDDEIGVVWGM